jgi:glucarate dehydratase
MKIVDVRLTPVAIKDPPLRNVSGIHEPYALRTIVELDTDEGVSGLGETYGDQAVLERLRGAAQEVVGLDPVDLNGLAKRVRRSLRAPTSTLGLLSADRAEAVTFAAFEVACLDLQGKAIGTPVAELLGGRVRDAVPFSAYLFFKHARHQPEPGYAPDEWGEAMDAEGVVEQARRMVDRYGFGSLKLKGGVLPPREECDVVLALRDAFPHHPLRIDPNTGWTVETSADVANRLGGTLEYLEDPTATIDGMAQVARRVNMPLATNMCVVRFADIPESVRRNAVQVVLADHHYWGGLRRSLQLAGICDVFGIGVSMHSNSHLGISLAAMTHLAAATPNLTYACDTHLPWQVEDVIEPGALRFIDGGVPTPTSPGLGVSLDRDALGRLAEQYEKCGIRTRDDVGAMRAIDPSWQGECPRW